MRCNLSERRHRSNQGSTHSLPIRTDIFSSARLHLVTGVSLPGPRIYLSIWYGKQSLSKQCRLATSIAALLQEPSIARQTLLSQQKCAIPCKRKRRRCPARRDEHCGEICTARRRASASGHSTPLSYGQGRRMHGVLRLHRRASDPLRSLAITTSHVLTRWPRRKIARQHLPPLPRQVSMQRLCTETFCIVEQDLRGHSRAS